MASCFYPRSAKKLDSGMRKCLIDCIIGKIVVCIFPILSYTSHPRLQGSKGGHNYALHYIVLLSSPYIKEQFEGVAHVVRPSYFLLKWATGADVGPDLDLILTEVQKLHRMYDAMQH